LRHKTSLKPQNTVKAVEGISFSVDEGELFGFLSPNGAGKTTAIKMLTTLRIHNFGQSNRSSVPSICTNTEVFQFVRNKHIPRA
jgi:ABC-type multidrug transport system ATPase subunit